MITWGKINPNHFINKIIKIIIFIGLINKILKDINIKIKIIIIKLVAIKDTLLTGINNLIKIFIIMQTCIKNFTMILIINMSNTTCKKVKRY